MHLGILIFFYLRTQIAQLFLHKYIGLISLINLTPVTYCWLKNILIGLFIKIYTENRNHGYKCKTETTIFETSRE